MSRIRVAVMSIALLTAFVAATKRVAAKGPATTQGATDPPPQLDEWWADLEKPEPWCSRALLDFSSKPDQAVAYFKEHVKPLKLEQKDLDDLLHALGNDDEKVWKPAFEKLEYLDPRLAEDLPALMQNTTEPVSRNHLAEILSEYGPDQLKNSSVSLRPLGNTDRYVFYCPAAGANSQRSWLVEGKVSSLDSEKPGVHKKQWVRADRAIVLLQHIGTSEALAVLKDLATGNPEAQPTKIAKIAVESLSGK